VRWIAAAVLVAAAPAHADDAWQVGAEGGAEWDSNVHRVEVPMDGSREPVAAALARAGARGAGAGERGWGRWELGGQALVRTTLGDDRSEDVGAVGVEARADRRLGERRARLGARASYYDVVALAAGGGPRAFALGGVDGLALLGSDSGARFALAAGVRDFRYKPDADFDWRGVAVGARFVGTVWERGAGDVDQPIAVLEVAAGYRLERRAFEGLAFTTGCAPDEPVEPRCFVPTLLRRGDLHHVAGVEVTYTGDVVATAGYQVIGNDSSSYGQSLIRHRLTSAVTAALPAQVFATAAVAVQVDHYLDPLLLAADVASQTFTSIDEENRSAVSVRVSRGLGAGWAAEARWAFYADSLSEDDLRFRRHLAYGGLTWSRGP
jgi:hypothetical protein